jgi:hypothetical protein
MAIEIGRAIAKGTDASRTAANHTSGRSRNRPGMTKPSAMMAMKQPRTNMTHFACWRSTGPETCRYR